MKKSNNGEIMKKDFAKFWLPKHIKYCTYFLHCCLAKTRIINTFSKQSLANERCYLSFKKMEIVQHK